MLTNTMLRLGAVGLLAIGVGCANNAPPASDAGNAALGIAEFRYENNATKTSVVGLDGTGQTIARLDLVHGRFAPTGMFQDDYPGQSEIDGRKLDVTIRGETHLVYETRGYGPVMHMPAHPPAEVELAAFLDDPRVKPVLDRWGIGFEPFAVDAGEVAFITGSDSGSSYTSCTTNCGTVRSLTANTCGGGNSATSAARVTRTSPYGEWMIAQCCPAGTGSQTTNWFARKSCPTSSGSLNNTCDPDASTNPDVNYSTAACKSCAGYPANASLDCGVTSGSGGLDYSYKGGTFKVDSNTAAPFHCFGGVYDIDLSMGYGCQGGGSCASGSPCSFAQHRVTLTMTESVNWSITSGSCLPPGSSTGNPTGTTFICDVSGGYATINAAFADGTSKDFNIYGYGP